MHRLGTALLQCTPRSTALFGFLTVAACRTMGRGEVITLQFGTFANYVGAHYWNIQVFSCSCYAAPHRAPMLLFLTRFER